MYPNVFESRFSPACMGGTQPPAGAPEEAKLYTCNYPTAGGCLHYHLTSIHLIRFLAQRQPLFDDMFLHKGDRNNTNNQWGRAVGYHLFPFDLSIVLAASGAKMIVG